MIENMLFTKRNLTKAFAISIPVLVFIIMNKPLDYLLNGIILHSTIEQGTFIVISSMIFSIAVSVIAVLICIKIWNRQILKI